MATSLSRVGMRFDDRTMPMPAHLRSALYARAGCETADAARRWITMTLEEFVVAVHRHRQRMALLVREWGGVIDDDTARRLVGMHNAHLFASAPEITTVDVLAEKVPSTGPRR